MVEDAAGEQRSIVKKLLVGLLLIAPGLLVVACGNTPTLLPSETATVNPPSSAAASIGSTPPASPEAAVTPTARPTGAASDLLLSAGTYVVGTGIPAGTYKGQALSEDSAYQISTDPDGKDVVETSPKLNDQFDLKLAKGQYLQVTGVMKITKVK
jgi:hypothetical protein